MSRVTSANTRPEMVLRSALHARGHRFRLHRRTLPGTPDIVLPRHRVAIFVNGCFWHGHDCSLFKHPATRPEFWSAKFERNKQRDREAGDELRATGWRVATIWECSLRGRDRMTVAEIVDTVELWLHGAQDTLDVRGRSVS